MAAKLFLNMSVILSSFFLTGFCEMTPESLSNALTQASGTVGGLLGGAAQDLNDGIVGPDMQCVQKLLPCQPYLHSPSSNPPATCCTPLNEMIKNETQCLCTVIANPEILKSLNVTKDDALNLVESCGAKADLSRCKNATSPASAPVIPTPSPPTDSSNGSSTAASSPPTSAAYKISCSALILAFFAGLIFSTY